MKQGALRYAKVLISGNLKGTGHCVRSESCQVTVSRAGTKGPLCLSLTVGRVSVLGDYSHNRMQVNCSYMIPQIFKFHKLCAKYIYCINKHLTCSF